MPAVSAAIGTVERHDGHSAAQDVMSMPGHLSPNVYDSDGQHEVRSHVAEVGTHEYAWHEAIEKGAVSVRSKGFNIIVATLSSNVSAYKKSVRGRHDVRSIETPMEKLVRTLPCNDMHAMT